MWLTQTLRQILLDMMAAEARGDDYKAEIVQDGTCYLGTRRISPISVIRLLQLTAIKECNFSGETMKRYRITDMGRAVTRRPEIIQEFVAALREKASYTIHDDRIIRI